MSKTCSICSNKNRDQIDRCLVSKVSYRNIREQFGVSLGAINRHVSEGHIQRKIEKSKELEDAKEGLELQACVQEVYCLCLDAAKAARKNDLRAFGSCIGPAIKVLEIMNKGSETSDTPPESSLLSSLKADVKETFKDDIPVGPPESQAKKDP